MSAKFIATPIIYENCRDAFSIRALRDIPMHGVKAGDVGGILFDKEALSQEGECWVGERCVVWGTSKISGNALVTCGVHGCTGESIIQNSNVTNNVIVRCDKLDNTIVANSDISGHAVIDGEVYYCHIGGYSYVSEKDCICRRNMFTPAFCDVIKPSPQHFPKYSKIITEGGSAYYVYKVVKIGLRESDFILYVTTGENKTNPIVIDHLKERIVSVVRSHLPVDLNDDPLFVSDCEFSLYRGNKLMKKAGLSINKNTYYTTDIRELIEGITNSTEDLKCRYDVEKMVSLLIDHHLLSFKLGVVYAIRKDKMKKFIKKNFNRCLTAKKEIMKNFEIGFENQE